MTSRLVEVSPGVFVATSRRDTTTSTVVRAWPHSPEVLLVDPAWELDELEALADDLDALGFVVAAGFSTHAHFDHLLWHPRLGRAPRWASPETARQAHDPASRAALLEELGPWPAALVPLVGAVVGVGVPDAVPARNAPVVPGPFPGQTLPSQARPVPAHPRLPWNGQHVELVVHDAHLPGHTALWLPGPRILLAGDMLSDVEPPLPASDSPADLDRYRAGLDALAPFVAQARLVIPGHGNPAQDAPARLALDRRALEALASHSPDPAARIAPV